MSEEAEMWDALQCLPDAVEHLIHGDPDDADSVRASDAVTWAIAEIARLREERRSITTLLQKIESLEAENERLREERRWVPVGERLPPFGADVLTLSFFSDGVPLVCIGWHNGQEWMHYTGRGPGLPVSHWQPLLPGPEANG